jgi:serine/threonine protein kinase
MATPATAVGFLEGVRKSGLVSTAQLNDLFGNSIPSDPTQIVTALIKGGLLTQYQATQLLAGKSRGFLLGPYKILQPIGRGGMGAVYLAEHTNLGRKVALKVLTAEQAKDKLTLERFNREARAVAALDHPNIVKLFDFSHAAGVHFLVMEFVDGNDLQSLMTKTGPLHYAQAAQYVAQAAAGLQHAHDKGFVHRDIKPANLMLAKDGTVKILDMGLARSSSAAGDKLTAVLAAGDIVGTVDFLSPEQARNHPLDARSDIYSLGATLYALVTGQPPFQGGTVQKLTQHQMQDPVPLSKKLKGRVSVALSDVVAKMMAKRASERYQSAAEVIDALAPWQPGAEAADAIASWQPSASNENTTQDLPTVAHFPHPAPRSVRVRERQAEGKTVPPWKRPPVLIGAGGGLLLLIVAIALALGSGGNTESPQANATGSKNPPGQSAPVGSPPDRTPAPANRPAGPVRGYRLDLSQQKEFTRIGTPAPTGDPACDMRFVERERTGTGEFPAGFERSTPFGDGQETEYAARLVDGVMAFGQRNLKRGQPHGASMILSPVQSFSGDKVRVRIEYRADGGAGGVCYVRFKGVEPAVQTWDVEGAQLGGTNGQWKTVEVEMPLQGATAGYFEIHNASFNPDVWLWVKGFEAGESNPPR